MKNAFANAFTMVEVMEEEEGVMECVCPRSGVLICFSNASNAMQSSRLDLLNRSLSALRNHAPAAMG